MIKPRVGALVNKQKMSLLVLFVVSIFVGVFCCENTYAYGPSGIVNELGSSQYILNTMGELQVKYQDEFAQNNIMFYDPCDGTSGGVKNVDGCAKLAELRQKMWNEASKKR